MKPIGHEKRAAIIAAKQRGESEKDIIKWLNVSRSAITKIWNNYQKTNSYEPKPYAGRKSEIDDETSEKIIREISTNPDITHRELIEKLSLPLTESGLSRWLKKINLTYKERRCMQKK